MVVWRASAHATAISGDMTQAIGHTEVQSVRIGNNLIINEANLHSSILRALGLGLITIKGKGETAR